MSDRPSGPSVRQPGACVRGRTATALLGLLVALLGVALSGCGGKPQADTAKKDAQEVQEILAGTAAGDKSGPRAPLTLPPGTHFTREDLPTEGGYLHLSLVEVTDAQVDRVLQRLKTEFCTCGCPHTIDDCLIQDPACTTARTLANQVIREIVTGS